MLHMLNFDTALTSSWLQLKAGHLFLVSQEGSPSGSTSISHHPWGGAQHLAGSGPTCYLAAGRICLCCKTVSKPQMAPSKKKGKACPSPSRSPCLVQSFSGVRAAFAGSAGLRAARAAQSHSCHKGSVNKRNHR